MNDAWELMNCEGKRFDGLGGERELMDWEVKRLTDWKGKRLADWKGKRLAN